MGKYNATAYDRKQAKELLAQGYKYLARDKEGILTAYDKKALQTFYVCLASTFCLGKS